MDIKITESSLRKFLNTKATAEEIAAKVSLCGPTFDRIHKVDDDYLFEIEAITNRIDTASSQGIAREAVAILNQFDIEAKMINDPYKETLDFDKTLPKKFTIDIESSDLCPRFTAIALSDVKIGPSPEPVKKFLELCGERSINNLVDITNEITILYGMPCHIFDLDKIKGQYLYVRKSKSKENLTTLDGQSCELNGNDIVIEDGAKRLIDLCGIMGGQEAVVDDKTNNLLLIVPVYHPKMIRKTSLYLQKRTLAAQIYEKQPDPELTLPVLKIACDLFQQRAGASISSSFFDYYPNPYPAKNIDLDIKWLNNFIGIDIKQETIIDILDDLGFGGTTKDQDTIVCTVPSFRYPDINIREDLAEEIARIYGYFRLPSVIPSVDLPAQVDNPVLTNESKAKHYLANIGFSEVFNNSLISLDTIQKSDLDPKDHLKLTNALSSDYEYLRISLLPSLLTNLKNNLGKVSGSINLFELSNVYIKQHKNRLPEEISTLSVISTYEFLDLKGMVESLLDNLNVTGYQFTGSNRPSTHVFDKNKTADITVGNSIIGQLGVLSPQVAENFGIDTTVGVVEFNFVNLVKNINPSYIYRPVSNYPSFVDDITLESNKPVGDLMAKIQQVSNFITKLEYLNSYQNKHTFRLTISSEDNNLTQDKVNQIKQAIQEKIS